VCTIDWCLERNATSWQNQSEMYTRRHSGNTVLGGWFEMRMRNGRWGCFDPVANEAEWKCQAGCFGWGHLSFTSEIKEREERLD
jgi:hypothetical protein